MPNDQFRRRHLPHQVPSGYPIFLTWNLKGSVPNPLAEQLRAEAKRLESLPSRADESIQDRRIRNGKLLFRMRDSALDTDCATCSAGISNERPMWLADPATACEVAMSFLWGVGKRYQLWAFVVMGNHTHVVLTPSVDLEVITHGIKGFTAYQINRLQDAKGRVFWQDESFDHWARDDEELYRIIEYVEQNPVAAGICRNASDWTWSSAWLRNKFHWEQGQPFPVSHLEHAQQLLRSLLDRTSGFPA